MGAKEFQGIDPQLEEIRELGDEYGATTGRPRQVNWLDLDMLEKASKINGVTSFVMNKVDILEEIQFWKLYEGINAMEFSSGNYMLEYIENYFKTSIQIAGVVFGKYEFI